MSSLVIEQDCIDAFEATGRVFLTDILDRSWDAVLITDLSELSDFSSCGLPAERVPSTDHLEIEQALKALYGAWNGWVIEKIFKRYGLMLETTHITLIELFREIEKFPQRQGKPLLH